MPRTLKKSRLHTKKYKPKIEQEVDNVQSVLPPNLEAFKQKILSRNGFVQYNLFFQYISELRRFLIKRCGTN